MSEIPISQSPVVRIERFWISPIKTNFLGNDIGLIRGSNFAPFNYLMKGSPLQSGQRIVFFFFFRPILNSSTIGQSRQESHSSNQNPKNSQNPQNPQNSGILDLGSTRMRCRC